MTTTTKDDVIQQRSKRGNENKAKAGKEIHVKVSKTTNTITKGEYGIGKRKRDIGNKVSSEEKE